MQRSKIKTTKRIPKKPLLFVLCGTLIIGVLITVLELTNTLNIFHKDTSSTLSETTADSPSKGEKQPQKNTPKPQDKPTNPNAGTEEKTPEPTAPTPSAPLATPHGDFVSSHRVNTNSMITSVCTTTPGAKCEIIFTMNYTQKSLPAEQTDSAGNVYWDWKPADIGLSPGTWKITAKSTLGNQVQTASDVISMEVSND